MAKRYSASELQEIDQKFLTLVENRVVTFVVADNSTAFRKTIVNALKKAGADEIAEAKDGIEAMLALNNAEGRPVLIAELNLPLTDALTMMAQIRQQREIKDTPIILMSAESRKERIVQAVRSGPQAYLRKPFEIESLLQKLRDLELL